MAKHRVGVYVDYSNVYSGARDAFMLDHAPGYRGNIVPLHLAKRVALHEPETGTPRRETHDLEFVKVFRGAPDPGRDSRGALMEAKRAHQWQATGCIVQRHTLDYGSGTAVEKGVDVRLTSNLILDAVKGLIDVAILVSADKDFRHALLDVRDLESVSIEVATWQAIPGGRAVGRIELRPVRSDEPEVPCHVLGRSDFGKLEDKIDYRHRPEPPGWRGPMPAF